MINLPDFTPVKAEPISVVTPEIKIVRDTYSSKSTLGSLYVGKNTFHTLELPWFGNKRSISCIPCGIYRVYFRSAFDSGKYNYDHLILQDVPGRDYILFHIANYPSDILGCIGVGLTRAPDFVGHSRKAFDKLMEFLDNYSDGKRTGFNLVIIDKWMENV